MNKIDTKNWRFFKFDKIFDIQKGFYNKKPESSGIGTIPFIGASDKNHGITDYYTIEEIETSSKTGKGKNDPIEKKLYRANAICVTNNGSVGYAYYLDKQFTCSHDVTPLYRKDGEFNYFTGMFVSSVIMYDRFRWGFGRKWRPARMKFSKIKLPISCDDSDNPIIDPSKRFSEEGFIPDWDYMEKFIKKLDYKIPQSSNVNNSSRKLDIDEWKTFFLSDIFDTAMGNGIDAGTVTDDMPCFKYVTRNRNNNGIVGTVDEIDGQKPFPPGSMTIALGGSYLGSCFLQTEKYYTGQNVGILIPKIELSKYTKLFLASIIRMESRTKYSAFGRELNKHFQTDFTLKLPVLTNDQGTPIIDETHQFSKYGYVPDWQFMEEYIKSIPNGDLL